MYLLAKVVRFEGKMYKDTGRGRVCMDCALNAFGGFTWEPESFCQRVCAPDSGPRKEI